MTIARLVVLLAAAATGLAGLSSAVPVAAQGAPAVTGVAVTSEAGADATYARGETVRVTGTPRVKLDLSSEAGDEKWADYTSGSGTTVLEFAYTVAQGDASRAGVAVLADTLELNGGTIRSAATQADAHLPHAGLAHDPDHRVDTAPPTLSVASVNGTTLKLIFDEALGAAASLANNAFTVKKTPQGSSEEMVSLAGTPTIGGATVTLTLASAVLATDSDVKVSYAKPTSDTGNRLKDEAGNGVASFSDESVKNVTGDTTPPTLVRGEIDGGTVTLYFSEPLDPDSVGGFFLMFVQYVETGTSQFEASGDVNINGAVVTVGVGEGHNRAKAGLDRNYARYYRVADPTAKALRDLAGNPVRAVPSHSDRWLSTRSIRLTNLTGVAPAQSGRTRSNAGDGGPATVTGVAVTSDAGDDATYGFGETVRVTVTFSEAVTITGVPVIGIDMDPAAWGEKRAAYESGSGTTSLTFAHTVVEPNHSTQGIAVLADSLALAGGTIRSAATGADAALGHSGLGHDANHKVDWRPALSVADARADEGANAAVAFEVSLDRAFTTAGHSVTVDYATADGTAKAGEDYTAASGTLTFAAGETAKTVSVAVLDDAVDEGEETFTLRLSNATGARIADGEAVGTIANEDPLQKIWLARFGRTVAIQTVEALEGRFAIAPDAAPRMAVTLAGRNVDLGRLGEGEALSETLTGLARAFGAPDPAAANDNGPFARHGLGGARNEAGVSATGRELLRGGSFHFTTGAASGLGDGAMTGWGKVLSGGSNSSLAGGLSFASETATGVLGLDWERDRLLLGVALSRTVETGSASFAPTGSHYEIEGRLSMVTPYLRVRAGERLSFWSAVGSGSGSLSLTRDGGSQTADIATRLAAAGGRAELLRPGPDGGLALALKTDAFFVRSESARVSTPGVGNLAAATGDASRVRAALEGSRSFALAEGGALEPSLSLGLRHDGGDAETGTGVEFGGRVSWADPDTGLSLEAAVRALVAHEDSDYREWGASGSLRLDPGVRGRGLSFSLAPTYGAPSSGVERLWSARGAQGLAPDAEDGGFEPESRLEGEIGYGLPLFGGRFTGMPNLGLGLSNGGARDYRLGWRLTRGTGDGSFDLSVEAARREPANPGPGSGAGSGAPVEHTLGLRVGARF